MVREGILMFKQLPGLWTHDRPTAHERRFAQRLLFVSVSLGSLVLIGKVVARIIAR